MSWIMYILERGFISFIQKKKCVTPSPQEIEDFFQYTTVFDCGAIV